MESRYVAILLYYSIINYTIVIYQYESIKKLLEKMYKEKKEKEKIRIERS